MANEHPIGARGMSLICVILGIRTRSQDAHDAWCVQLKNRGGVGGWGSVTGILPWRVLGLQMQGE